MKKIITLLSLFNGVFSQAQYIEPTRFEVELNAGYSIPIGAKGNGKNIFESSLSGLIYEASVFYRTGFASKSLIGIKANHVNGKKFTDHTLINFGVDDLQPITRTDQERLTYIGSSYRYEVINIPGTRMSSVDFTAGYLMHNNTNSFNSFSNSVKSNGYGLGVHYTYGFTIIDNLFLNINWQMDYFWFKKGYTIFDIQSTNPSMDVRYSKENFARVNLLIGLKYKL